MNFIKNILSLSLLLLPFILQGQTVIPYPAYFSNIDNVSSIGGGLYDLTVTVNDQSGSFNGLAVDTTNFVLWQNCGRYEIDSVLIKFSGQIVIRVNDIDTNGSPILGEAAILEESPQNIGFFVSGILNSQNQCIASYYTQFIGTGSGSGGADTLYLSDGTMLVNGDTIPNLSCSTERIVAPFDFSDRVVVSTVVINSFEILDVFVNGVYFNSNAYSISTDSLIFNTYTIQSGDEIFIRSCQSVVGSSTPNINQVLSSGNNAGGIQLKNIADPVDAQDAVTLSYFENNSGGDDTLYLSDGTMLVNGDTIPVFDCSSQRFFAPFPQNDRVIVSSGTIDAFELINVYINGVHYEQETYTISGDSIIFDNYILANSDAVFLNVCSVGVGSATSTTLNAVLSNSNDGGGLPIKNIGTPVDGNDVVTKQYFENNNRLFYKDGVEITGNDTLSSFVKADAIETVQNTNFTATLGIVNIVNTTSTAIQVTPPASPSIGDCFAVVDGTGNGSNNNITVAFSGSGENFHSISQNYVMNLDNDFAEFLYVGSTTGWVRKK